MKRLAVLLALAACHNTVTVYHRTSPRRVEVTKQASPASLFVQATRTGEGEVQIHVKHANRVTLERTLLYNASAMQYGHSKNPLYELVEFGVACLMASLAGGFWGFGERIDGQNTPTRKLVRHRHVMLALFDPTTSVIANNIKTEPIVKEQVFSDPAVVREYEIRLPAPNTAISYRLLDETGGEIAKGGATTDIHGEVRAASADTAIAVEVAAEGKTMVVPILAKTLAPAQESPAEAAPPPPPPITLVNEGWTIVRKQKTRVRHVTLGGDAMGPLLYKGVIGAAEVRLTPRLSISGLVGFGKTTYGLTDGSDLEGSFTGAGGQATYYVKGDFSNGIQLGGEYVFGEVDIPTLGSGRRKFTRTGINVGYKYTMDIGLTANLQGGVIYAVDDDVEGGNQLAGPELNLHLLVGFSL